LRRHLGVPTVLIPINSDRRRGDERAGNSESARVAAHLVPPPTNETRTALAGPYAP